MRRCVLREAWRQFKDSDFAIVCVAFILLIWWTAIGYGLWTLLGWWLGKEVVGLSFMVLVFLGLAIGLIKLLWRGIDALAEIVINCMEGR